MLRDSRGSSVWVDYFSGNGSAEADFLDKTPGNRPVAIGDLILTEVLQGFRHHKRYKTARRLLEELTLFDLLGQKMAIKSSENFRKLCKNGITIRKTVEVIITSFCIGYDLPLLLSDKDFRLLSITSVCVMLLAYNACVQPHATRSTANGCSVGCTALLGFTTSEQAEKYICY